MKVTYLDHMADDLSVVNAAKVSFGKRSELIDDPEHVYPYPDHWEIGMEVEWTRDKEWGPSKGTKGVVAELRDEYSGRLGYEYQVFYVRPKSGRGIFWTTPDDVKLVGSTKKAPKKVLSKKDQGLIQFLARGCTSGEWDVLVRDVSQNGHNIIAGDVPDIDRQYLEDLLNHIRKMPSHWSPFAHTAITLHLKMPIFVARQIMKHTTGIEYNEVSRRYVDSEPEFYVPDVWRKKADNVKQGSSDEGVKSLWYNPTPQDEYDSFVYNCIELYDNFLKSGVAPEQARMVLPQSMYTEVIATGNLYAWANLYVQRTDSHAQKETQDLAKQIGEIIQPLYPVSWEALTK
jgi:thymidylate synthase (FAD)